MTSATSTYTIRAMHPYELLIKRSILIITIGFYMYRYYAHLLPHQLIGAPLTKILYYPEFHAYRWLGLDDLLIQSPIGSAVYSIVLVLIPVLLLWRPRHRILSILFIISLLLYHTTQGVHMTHAVHFLVGIVLVSAIFLARRPSVFDVIWEGIRYGVCILYGSAFIWKFLHGAFFQIDFGTAAFKSNLATYLYLYPESNMTLLYRFFLQYPVLLNIGTYLSFLIEGAFIIGFFTKRFDIYLIIFILFLHHALYLFVDTLFVEWYILVLPFIPLSLWSRATQIRILQQLNQ